MAYLGRQPVIGNFVKLDDISTQFDGSLTTFNTLVSGAAYTVSNPYATLVGGNGAVYNPGIDYYFNSTTIVFATAPSATLNGKFFCMVFGDSLNSGIPSDGTITNEKLAAGTIQYSALASTTKGTLLAYSLIFGA
jgi:hypothetical protein